MNRKIFNSSAAAIIIIGILVGFYLWKDLTKEPSFSSAKAERGNIQEILDISGKIKPQDDSSLGFEVSGKVLELAHKNGDRVAQGEILARLDDKDLQADYAQSAALANSARSILEEDKALEDRELHKLKSIKKENINLNDKKAQQEQVDAQKALVSSQEAQVAAAQAGVAAARSQLDKAVIRAPYSGMVANQNIQEGEIAAIGTPILTLVNDGSFEIDANVSELDVQKIKIGQEAKISLLENPGEKYLARISEVDPAQTDVNGVSNYHVVLQFASAPSSLRSGMSADISVIAGDKNNVLVVPKSAVFQENNRQFVYVANGNAREKKEVETGIYGADQVEIISGISEGDNILVLTSK